MANRELATLTAGEVVDKIAGGDLSAADYAAALIAQIEAVDGTVRAFAHFDPDHVMTQARALDDRRARGEPVGPLHGIPVAIKDIFDTADQPTECGSPLLKGRRPDRDASTVARLRAAGAVILGKAVTTEFAFYNPGPTVNPRDPQRTPGGSSSGSAAAVAAGMAPLALGSQTNGSTIRPGAFCGVFAMKPTHGLIGRGGVLTLSKALDHVGLFARSLADIALLMDVLAGYDPLDSDTRPVASPDFLLTLMEPPPVVPDFAFVRTPVWDKTTPDTRAAFEALTGKLGERVKTVDLPDGYAAAWADQGAVMAVDMASNLGALVDRGTEESSSKVLRELIAKGRAISATDYLAALARAPRYRAGIVELFDQYDAIITPAAPGIAPMGQAATGDPSFCTLWTLVGLPAVTLPVLTGEGGLPLGLQLIGAPNKDAQLLRTARWLIESLSR
ncbi:MAG: amidase [Pseudolabrys sp.]